MVLPLILYSVKMHIFLNNAMHMLLFKFFNSYVTISIGKQLLHGHTNYRNSSLTKTCIADTPHFTFC